MKTLHQLAKRNLKGKRTTVICILFYLVMAFGLSFLSLLIHQLQNGMDSAKNRIGADIVIVPENYCSSINQALFQGYPCTVYFEKEWMDLLEGMPEIENVTSQVFLATLDAECCDSAVQLIAYDRESDFLIKPWIMNQIHRELTEDEIVVGSEIKVKLGQEVTYYGETFKVAGKLESTGVGYDQCVFITKQAKNKILSSEMAQKVLVLNQLDDISAIMIRAKDGIAIDELKKKIEERYRSQGADLSKIRIETSLELFHVVMDSMNKIQLGGKVIGILIVFIISIALVGIHLVLMESRHKEFGVYLTLGANTKQLYSLVLKESMILSSLGSFLGIFIAYTIFLLFQNLIQSSMGLPYMPIRFIGMLTVAIKTLLITEIVGIVTSIASIMELNRYEEVSIIKEYEVRK